MIFTADHAVMLLRANIFLNIKGNQTCLSGLAVYCKKLMVCQSNYKYILVKCHNQGYIKPVRHRIISKLIIDTKRKVQKKFSISSQKN